MSPKVPRVSGKEMIKFLQSRGFSVVRVRGSHYVLRNALGITIVVPVHSGETLGIGLIRKVLSQAGIDPSEYIEYFS